MDMYNWMRKKDEEECRRNLAGIRAEAGKAKMNRSVMKKLVAKEELTVEVVLSRSFTRTVEVTRVSSGYWKAW